MIAMREIRANRQWYQISALYRTPNRSICARLFKIFMPIVVFFWMVIHAKSKFASYNDPQFMVASSSSSSALFSDLDFLSAPSINPVMIHDRSQAVVTAAEIRRVEVIDHLIVVAGHSVMRIDGIKEAEYSEESWYLLSYQKGQDLPKIITSHVKKGVDVAREDLTSFLIFTGGQTRKDVGPTSEAASYYYLADQRGWLNDIKGRVYLEEYARDSYENLLFSVCRFREVAGNYPSRVTVIGFDFKSKRFTELHRGAIGFPLYSFSYVGLKPEVNSFDYSRAVKGEKYVLDSFKNDMYGCGSMELLEKRKKRNPFKRSIPYMSSCPEIHELLTWCGPDMYDGKKLPWYSGNPTAEVTFKNKLESSRKGGYLTTQERMNGDNLKTSTSTRNYISALSS